MQKLNRRVGLAWIVNIVFLVGAAGAQVSKPESLRPASTDKPIGALATLLLDNRAGSVSEEAMPERLKQIAATSLEECFQALKNGHFDVRTAEGARANRPLQGWEYSMVLDVFAHNSAAQKFYEALGFSPIKKALYRSV